MKEGDELFEVCSKLYPQPIALGCGRICRARSLQERLDAILKCAEVVTRNLAVLSISSFAAREDASASMPVAFTEFTGPLSFGNKAAFPSGGKSQSRNPILSLALRLLSFAEFAGSGLREVHLAWRQVRRRPPTIKSDDEANTLTLTQNDARFYIKDHLKPLAEEARVQ